jgi:hypothetical protein
MHSEPQDVRWTKSPCLGALTTKTPEAAFDASWFWQTMGVLPLQVHDGSWHEAPAWRASSPEGDRTGSGAPRAVAARARVTVTNCILSRKADLIEAEDWK